MADKIACEQCGADNDALARRCRICANLLNPDVAEEDFTLPGLSVDADAVGEQKLSSEEIERIARDALREERMKKRPGFLDKRPGFLKRDKDDH